MTVINAADRFRRHADVWIGTRRGFSSPLSEYRNEYLIRRLMAEAAAKYPGTDRVLALHWDDKSCASLEILFECDEPEPPEIKGHVEVDDGYYEVTLTPMSRSAA